MTQNRALRGGDARYNALTLFTHARIFMARLDATMATIKEGKLLKRSPQSTLFGGKKMQERFLILRADALLYYLPSDAEGIAAGRSGEASSRCKGMIPIEDVIGVYRAFELPTDSKDMQKMARSLMPSEAPATIFIPVAQRDSAERMKGNVRIYELRDSDAAGAASWVEALRAAVDLPHSAAASAHESASAAKSAVTKARKAQVALEVAQAAEVAKDAIAAADAANVEAIGAEAAAVKAAAALQRIPTTMQDLRTAAAAAANEAREGAAEAARAADAAADVAAKKEAREARRQQSGARPDPEATEAAAPTAAAAVEAAVEAAAFETAAAAIASAVASAAIPQTPPPHPTERVSWYADATSPAATSMHVLTTAPSPPHRYADAKSSAASDAPLPATPSDAPLPATPSDAILPATPSNPPLPATPSNPPLPATPSGRLKATAVIRLESWRDRSSAVSSLETGRVGVKRVGVKLSLRTASADGEEAPQLS